MLLSVPEIDLLPSSVAAPTIERHNTAATAREFDTMVLEVLLRHSGLLQSLTSAHGAEQVPLVSEVFLHSLAQDLARQLNLGFGNLVAAQAQPATGGKK